MKTMNCPLCSREIYSKFGMILEDKGKEFCSKNAGQYTKDPEAKI